MTLRLALLLALPVLTLALGACEEEDGATISGGGPVLGEIPWDDNEIARYTLFEGDDDIGTGTLTVACEAPSAEAVRSCQFQQSFEFPEREITDEVRVRAAADTLAPEEVTRVVDSPDGVRTWNARYRANNVTVIQADEDDERSDTLEVPSNAYDTWTDLFLWRTLDFRQGYEVEYQAVVTADFAKPDVITIVLEVTGKETVTVPAGSFEAWRLEVRSGGTTQRAWIADDETRALVRYDNTQLVFELEP